MKILITTDNHIVMNRELSSAVESVVEGAIERFRRHLTRVEVHLSDENANKGGDRENRCVIEAHIFGMNPVVVTDYAATFEEAITRASHKMTRLLEAEFGKLDDKRPREERLLDGLIN